MILAFPENSSRIGSLFTATVPIMYEQYYAILNSQQLTIFITSGHNVQCFCLIIFYCIYQKHVLYNRYNYNT